MMRRFLLLAVFFLLPTLSFAQTSTVTGHILYPSGGASANGKACFTLQNFKPNSPRVSGTGVIVQNKNFCVNASSVDGSFSTTLYRNDQITPGSTYWRVDFLWNGQQESSANYSITSATYNLDSATPMVITPLPTNGLLTSSYNCQVGSALSTWTCTHNFNDKNVTVTVYDLNGAQIFPNSLILTDTNTVTLTWITPQAGNAVIIHASAIAIANSQPNAVLQAPSGAQIINSSQALTINAATTHTGNNSHSGIETYIGALNSTNTTTGISACLENGYFVAGSSCYPTIQAAITAAGTTATVLIPSNYAGVDIYNNPNSISVIDLRPSVGGYGGMTVGTGVIQFPPSVSTANTAFGAGVLVNGIQTVNNSAFGFGALNSELVGASNSAFGRQALGADTYGRFNSGFGVQALQANVSGSFNTAMGGEGVLSNHLFGDYNSAYGDSAMQLNISGQDNTSIGESSLFSNTTGSLNTAVGSSALFSQTASSQNTAVGNTALFAVNAGKAITAFSNFGGGQVQATSNGHGFSNGNSVIISGSTFQIPSPLIVPLVSQNASGGSITAGTYWVKITLFHCTHSQTFAADCPTNPPQTETTASPETSIVIAAGGTNQIIVTRPVLRPSIADGFCVYMSTSSGNETKQGCEIGFASAANLAGTITFNTCCSAGAAVPVANTTAGNNYNGTYAIANVAANTFTFTATFVGTQTGAYAQLASAATNNAAVGYGAGAGVTTGSQNAFLGADLSHTITQGSTNTCLGYSTCSGITTGSGNTVVGAFVSGLPAGLTQNIILADGSGGIRAQWDLTNWNFSTPIVPTAAGTQSVGTGPLPYGAVFIGTAATNNFKFQPASTTGARIITIADPLSPTTVALPLTIANGTTAMTTALIATVACGTTATTAATGVLTTDVIDWSMNAAVTATNNGLLILKAWPTAGNVNFNYCNPTAAGVTPTAMTVNWSVRRP